MQSSARFLITSRCHSRAPLSRAARTRMAFGFAEAAQRAVDGVVGLLVTGQVAAGGLLDRDAEGLGLPS
jgi:hypothetical protein